MRYCPLDVGMRRRAGAGAPRHLAVAVALAVAAVSGASAHAAQPSPINNRWSGYVVTARQVSFTRVAGSWTVPLVTCTKGAVRALSTVWVGIGGYTTDSKVLDQVGTDANCDSGGHARYHAWFELLPDIAHPIDKRIGAGDTMSGSMVIAKTNLIELTLRDLTRNWTFAATIQVGAPDVTSAEWVVEAPYSCQRFLCHQAPLANFGSVVIRDISATGNGHRGTLATRSWKRTALVAAPCAQDSVSKDAATGTAAAISGPVSTDGTEFPVTWAHQPGAARHCPGGTVGGVPDVTIG